MQRRNFIRNAVCGAAGLLLQGNRSLAAPPSLKITKIRYYAAPGYNKPLFNQARGIVEIETDGGIIGIGEGGTKDMVEQCASRGNSTNSSAPYPH